ncbi:MAG: hypothetical protein R6V32_05395 [Bacteroidales bacterium]
MKCYFYILVLILFLFTACNEEEQETETPLSSNVTEQTGCKNFTGNIRDSSEITSSMSCIEYSYDDSEMCLSLSHINAGFNCCPGELYCEVSMNSDTILVQEFETEAACDCHCLFDMEMEVNRVKSGNYYLKIEEPYAHGQASLEFEINLSTSPTGSYCVERTDPPWGH